MESLIFVLIETWINKNSSNRGGYNWLTENNDHYQAMENENERIEEETQIYHLTLRTNEGTTMTMTIVKESSSERRIQKKRRLINRMLFWWWTKIIPVQEIERSTEIVTQINCFLILCSLVRNWLDTGHRTARIEPFNNFLSSFISICFSSIKLFALSAHF